MIQKSTKNVTKQVLSEKARSCEDCLSGIPAVWSDFIKWV